MKDFSTNRAGDFAEYYAVTWLWDQGYDVFKNAGCDGPIDLIARSKDGSIILIDVKTFRIRENNTYTKANSRTPEQIEMGVQLLGFCPDRRECYFIEHRDETTYSRYRDKQQALSDMVCGDTGC